jgi:hypothetical protein
MVVDIVHLIINCYLPDAGEHKLNSFSICCGCFTVENNALDTMTTLITYPSSTSQKMRKSQGH